MTTAVEKKFDIEVIYNGIGKSLQVQPEESVTALLQKAIKEFHITQNPHLLSLFRQDGSVVSENESVERAGIKPREFFFSVPMPLKEAAEFSAWRRTFLRKPFGRCASAVALNANAPCTGLGPRVPTW